MSFQQIISLPVLEVLYSLKPRTPTGTFKSPVNFQPHCNCGSGFPTGLSLSLSSMLTKILFCCPFQDKQGLSGNFILAKCIMGKVLYEFSFSKRTNCFYLHKRKIFHDSSLPNKILLFFSFYDKQ